MGINRIKQQFDGFLKPAHAAPSASTVPARSASAPALNRLASAEEPQPLAHARQSSTDALKNFFCLANRSMAGNRKPSFSSALETFSPQRKTRKAGLRTAELQQRTIDEHLHLNTLDYHCSKPELTQAQAAAEVFAHFHSQTQDMSNSAIAQRIIAEDQSTIDTHMSEKIDQLVAQHPQARTPAFAGSQTEQDLRSHARHIVELDMAARFTGMSPVETARTIEYDNFIAARRNLGIGERRDDLLKEKSRRVLAEFTAIELAGQSQTDQADLDRLTLQLGSAELALVHLKEQRSQQWSNQIGMHSSGAGDGQARAEPADDERSLPLAHWQMKFAEAQANKKLLASQSDLARQSQEEATMAIDQELATLAGGKHKREFVNALASPWLKALRDKAVHLRTVRDMPAGPGGESALASQQRDHIRQTVEAELDTVYKGMSNMQIVVQLETPPQEDTTLVQTYAARTPAELRELEEARNKIVQQRRVLAGDDLFD